MDDAPRTSIDLTTSTPSFVAVHGRFDRRTRRFLQEAKHWMRSHGLPAVADDTTHLSFAVCSKVAVAAAENEIVGLHPTVPMSVRFTHIGVFPHPIGIVFVGTALNEQLQQLHESIHDRLEAIGAEYSKWYMPGRWTPHASLAMPVSSDNLGDAVQGLDHIDLPFSGYIESVHAVEVTGVERLEYTANGAQSR